MAQVSGIGSDPRLSGGILLGGCDSGGVRRGPQRGCDHPHAVRILARAWLYVIWDCWQHRAAYDPAQHRALQRLLATGQAA
jgi:hypothetical protein